MDTRKITDHITLIKGKNQGRFPFSHSILIEDDITALIDTGCGIDYLNQLKSDVDIVIKSHSHPDHTAGNWVFTGIPLTVPQEEGDFNSDITKLSVRYAGEYAAIWRDVVFNCDHFIRCCCVTEAWDVVIITKCFSSTLRMRVLRRENGKDIDPIIVLPNCEEIDG